MLNNRLENLIKDQWHYKAESIIKFYHHGNISLTLDKRDIALWIGTKA